MDVDFWSSRVNSTNNISAVQSTYLINSDCHLNVDNEGEEDIRTWFPCPFCYVEIEVPMLCCHLQDEHCFDLKNGVCPICAASLGKDPIVHFSVQHAQSVKRRRKYLKSGYWDNATAMIQDITSYFETNSGVTRYKGHEPAPDPLLLPFLCNVPPTDTQSRWQDKSSVCHTATTEIESRKLLVAVEEDSEEEAESCIPSRADCVNYLLVNHPIFVKESHSDFTSKTLM